jgi:5'-phosphate synthase pdxT subunit
MKIGVLALQGAVQPHQEKLAQLQIEAVPVRTAAQLAGLSGIILPGGESSTMLHLLKLNQLWDPLKQFLSQKPGWGLCAGAILLARHVTAPEQASLALVDITVARNAFGRQLDSFIDTLSPTDAWKARVGSSAATPIEGVFIRAPRITAVGAAANVLFQWKQEPVMVQQGNLLASTFHPELTDSVRLHDYFASLCHG